MTRWRPLASSTAWPSPGAGDVAEAPPRRGRWRRRRACRRRARSTRARSRRATLFFAIRGDASTATRSCRGRVERRRRPASWRRTAGRGPPCRPGVRCHPRRRHDARAAALGAARPPRVGRAVVAITGSAGKTTTKEMTADLLGAALPRVPQPREPQQPHRAAAVAARAATRPDVAVVELGMNHAGEIRVAGGHRRAGRARLDATSPRCTRRSSRRSTPSPTRRPRSSRAPRVDGLLVANADDPLVMARVATSPGAGHHLRHRCRGGRHGHRREDDGPRGHRGDGDDAAADASRFAVPLIGRGHLANALAAIAVATHFDVPLDAVAERVAAFTPATHRGEVLRLRDGVTLVDDSYNSNPRALQRTLEAIAAERGCTRRASPCWARCWNSASRPPRCTRPAGGRRRTRGSRTSSPSAARRLRPWRPAPVAAGMPSRAVAHVATSQEAADTIVPLIAVGRPAARQGLARDPNGSRRGSCENGAGPMSEFTVRGKRVVVVGGARSGVAAARLLVDRGARVVLTDLRGEIEGQEGLARLGVAARARRPPAGTAQRRGSRGREPGRADRAGTGRRRAQGRRARDGRGRAGVALAARAHHRDHRHEREVDDGRAHRPDPRRGRPARARGRQHRDPAGGPRGRVHDPTRFTWSR